MRQLILYSALGVLCIFSITGFAQQKIYWADENTDAIHRSNVDGTNSEQIISTDIAKPKGIAVDLSGGKIYWTDDDNSTDHIKRANLDGTNQEDLITGLDKPRGIALDIVNGKVYWTDEGFSHIRRANLDGSNPEDVLTGLSILIKPKDIALDIPAGKIYWTDDDKDSEHIARANLDGTNPEVIVSNILKPRGIELDLSAGKVYWIDENDNDISSANLDGTSATVLISGLQKPKDITLDLINNKIFWSEESNSGTIKKSDLNGSNIETIETGILKPRGIDLGIGTLETDCPVVVTNTFTDVSSLVLNVSFSDASNIVSFEILVINNMTVTIDGNDFSNTGVYTTGYPKSSTVLNAVPTGAGAKVVYKITDGAGNVKIANLHDR